MGEVGEGCADGLGGGGGLGNGHVGGVGLFAEGVEDDEGGALGKALGFWCDFAAIGKVTEFGACGFLGEDVAEGVYGAVGEGCGLDGALGERELGGHGGKVEGGVAAVARLFADGVGVDGADAVEGGLVSIDGECEVAAEVAEAAEVVHAEDVIGVAVGEEDTVHPSDVVGEALHAELLGGVHLEVKAVHDDMNAGAGAPVFGVGEVEARVLASDHGDALRGPCAHKDDFHVGNESRAVRGSHLKKEE